MTQLRHDRAIDNQTTASERSTVTTAPKKKLIEVSLPLEAINAEASREKSIRHGHPSTLHLYWARRPLAAARAVLFAQLVDDPSSRPEEFPTVEAQDAERARLHALLEKLVVWENSNDEALLAQAREEIRKSNDGELPAVLDPFAGGGAIPLEAQRLGLEAHASDLNPLAVLINKALIEIPPKFAGVPPVFPGAASSNMTGWDRAEGLAEDVRRYGTWMRDEAERRIGHLYPKVKAEGGTEHPVIAWMGPHCEEPQPRKPDRGTPRALVVAEQEEGQGSLGARVSGGRRSALRGAPRRKWTYRGRGRHTKSPRRGKSRGWHADFKRLHQR
jgi:putative DNA methylase